MVLIDVDPELAAMILAMRHSHLADKAIRAYAWSFFSRATVDAALNELDALQTTEMRR